MNVEFAEPGVAVDWTMVRQRTWPDLRRLWEGFKYAAAVACLFAVIALLVAMPD